MIINKYFHQHEEINIENKNTPVEKILQTAVNIPNFHTKLNYLKFILSDEELKKVLVFADNKKDADLIFETLSDDFPDQLSVIHSNKSQNFRFNAIKSFDKGQSKILVATDVVARGLDFTDITHVISMSPPENASDYIHRIGRTGRAEKDGSSILMYSPFEEDSYHAVKDLAGKKLLEPEIPVDIEISKLLTEDEKPGHKQKNYLKAPDLNKSGGAFQEKSEKRQKENSGGAGQKSKKRKGLKRSGKKK
jgi:ATP-dependent RNA helicase RhlE